MAISRHERLRRVAQVLAYRAKKSSCGSFLRILGFAFIVVFCCRAAIALTPLTNSTLVSALGSLTNLGITKIRIWRPNDHSNCYYTSNHLSANPIWLTNSIGLTNPYISFRTNLFTFVSAGQILGATSIVTTVTNWALAEAMGEEGNRLRSLSIVGRGYFVVRAADGTPMVTRDGSSLYVDDLRYLVTRNGLRVQGFKDPSLEEIGDLQIDSQYRPEGAPADARVHTYNFESDGRILVTWCDGTKSLRGQILLQDFRNPSLLAKEADRLWWITDLAEPLAKPLPPTTQGLGSLAVGLSQYDLTTPCLSVSVMESNSWRVAPGLIRYTQNPNDLAIRGKGFFILREPNSNAFYATRAGAFCLDPYGHLVNYAGWRVQGHSDGTLTEIGDVVIDSNGRPATTMSDALMRRWTIGRSGEIHVYLSDGTRFLRGCVLLQDCSAPAGLVRDRWGAYERRTSSGLWTPLSRPNAAGMGSLVMSALELRELEEEMLVARRRQQFRLQGPFTLTGNSTDLAIIGLGFFQVRDPVTDALYATRNGAFHVDTTGFLVTTNGLRVQGFSDPELSILGDVRCDASCAPATASPDSTVTKFDVFRTGEIWLTLSDNTCFRRGQILLQNFRNPSALDQAPDQLWSNLEEAMPMFAAGVAGPNAMPLGDIHGGGLELITTIPEFRLPPRYGIRLAVRDLPAMPWLVSVIESSSDLVHWTKVSDINPIDIDESEAFGPMPVPGEFRAYRIRTSLIPGNDPFFPDPWWVRQYLLTESW